MLGDTPEQAAGALAEVRKRDASRLAQQMAGSDSLSGRDLTLVGPNAQSENPPYPRCNLTGSLRPSRSTCAM